MRRGQGEAIEGINAFEQPGPTQMVEDQSGRQRPLVGGDVQRQAGGGKGPQHGLHPREGLGLAITLAVVMALKGGGKLIKQGRVAASAAELCQGFTQGRADQGGCQRRPRLQSARGEGLAKTRQDAGGRIHQGAVQVEDDRLHGRLCPRWAAPVRRIAWARGMVTRSPSSRSALRMSGM